MTGDDAQRAAARAQIESAIADYIMDGTETADIRREVAKRFPGTPRTTLYRWIADAIKNGAAGRLIQARGAAVQEAQAIGASAVLGQAVPAGSVTAIPLAEKISLAIDTIESVLRYARGEDPARPRNPKLAVKSAVDLTRALESAMRLHEALTQAARLDGFHEALIAEVEKEAPEVAARITARLRAMTGQIGG